jgi:hypothetical protein
LVAATVVPVEHVFERLSPPRLVPIAILQVTADKELGGCLACETCIEAADADVAFRR